MHKTGVDSEWVVTLGAAFALLAGVAGSMMHASRRAGRWQGRVEARWREIAELFGSTLEVESRGALTPRRLAMRVASEDSAATAEVNVPVDSGAPSHTRVRASFALGTGPSFRMSERRPTDAPGMEREVLPDRALSRRVRLEADEPRAMTALFSPAACAHAAAFRRPILLRSDGRTIELVWDGVELDADVLAHGLGLVREVAALGTPALRALAELEGAMYVPTARGGPLVRVVRERAAVELVAQPSPEGIRAVATAEPRRSLPSFTARIVGGELDGPIPPGVVGADVVPLLRDAGECTLSSADGKLELAWGELPSKRALDAGAKLLASIAGSTGSAGVFR